MPFETIHPFLDGNWRVGRRLIPLMFGAEGILRRLTRNGIAPDDRGTVTGRTAARLQRNQVGAKRRQLPQAA